MNLLRTVALFILLIGWTFQVAQAQIQLGPDGHPTGITRDQDGTLRTTVGRAVVKFACTPSNFLMSNEVEATIKGAPSCTPGYKATMWYCIPNGMMEPDEVGMTQRDQGEPDCGPRFTAVRQPVFAPNKAPKGSPHVIIEPENPNSKPLTLGNDALPDEIIIAPKFHYTISAQPVVNSGISGTLSVHKPFSSSGSIFAFWSFNWANRCG
jgi:hypothetical protein